MAGVVLQKERHSLSYEAKGWYFRSCRFASLLHLETSGDKIYQDPGSLLRKPHIRTLFLQRPRELRTLFLNLSM